MRKLCSVILATMLLSACATYRPMVDMQEKEQWKYNSDVMECQQYAERVDPGSSALLGAGVGAGVGAALGAIVGAFFGCPGETAAFGAALFGASGGIQGAAGAGRTQKDIIRRCMQGRGWNVLD